MSDTRFRIEIDGTWTAKEMGDLFQSCDIIYRELSRLHSDKLYQAIYRQTNDPTPQGNADGRDKLLRVTCVSYASPGWADLLGAGELAGHLKDFLISLLDRIIEKKDREQARSLRRTEIESAALENYARQLDLLDRAWDFAERRELNDSQRQQLLNQILGASRPIGQAMADGRITKVKNLPTETR